MSWIVAGLVVAGSTAYGAYKGSQQKEAYGEAKIAAQQIQQQKVALLGEQKGLATQAAQSQFVSGQRNIGMSTNMELRRTQAFGEQAYSQSNLATSGTIEQKVQTQTGDLLQKYTNMTKDLFETRNLAKAQADLSYRKGEMSAEESFQNTMAGFDEGGMGAGAVEGFMSSISLAV